MTIFERIKKTADERGLTLTQVSTRAGLGEKTIYKWKYNDPSAPRLQAVADVLHVSVDYLLGNTAEPDDVATQVGGLFRSVTNQEDLTEDEQNDIKRDIEILLKTRAERLREERRKP